MRLRYPGSFLGLIAVGFGLAVIPVLVSLVDTLVDVRKLAHRSQDNVAQAVRLTRAGRSLSEELTTFERVARQQLVLNDRSAIESLERARTRVTDTLQRLQSNAQAGESQRLLAAIDANTDSILHLLRGPYDEPPVSALQTLLGSMSQQQLQLRDVIEQEIEGAVAQTTGAAEALQRRVLIQMALILPLALVVGLIAMRLVRRPLNQLEDAILRLGDGRLTSPIEVGGPRDLRALGEQLEWLRLRLAEVDTQKTRFLRHVSHELKTPLTAVHEGSQLLSDGVGGELNEAQREIAGILRENVTRLRQLIENLLDYSSIRFQPMLLTREPVLLADVFSRVANDHRLALTAKHLTLNQRDAELTIPADADKLRAIIDNLLSNAIKYAPENSVIELLARHDGNWAIIDVADFGPGVPEKARDTVFEPFVQGPPPKGAAIKGTGLGLSIVKELVTAHGGEVALQSNHPVGTRVRIRLPLGLINPAPSAP